MTDKKLREAIELKKLLTPTIIDFSGNPSIENNLCEEIIQYVPEPSEEIQGCAEVADTIVKDEVDFYFVDEAADFMNGDSSNDALVAEVETQIETADEEDYEEEMYDSNHDSEAFDDFIVEEVSQTSKEDETTRQDETVSRDQFGYSSRNHHPSYAGSYHSGQRRRF